MLNEMLLCVGLGSIISPSGLSEISNHCNDWCKGEQIRIKVLSGRHVFISTNKKSSLLSTYDLGIGERVRTPIGLALLIGTSANKLWCTFEESGNTWYFNCKQIKKGKEKGFFNRCSYDKTNLKNIEELIKDNNVIPNYDLFFLNEIMDPIRWTNEIDTLLISFLIGLAEKSNTTIWNITCEQIYDEYRGLQILLSRLVMKDADLSHRWGISGPKRKAVIARLGKYLSFHSLFVFISMADCFFHVIFSTFYYYFLLLHYKSCLIVLFLHF